MISSDKLIAYTILMFISSLFVALICRIYVIKNYQEAHFKFIFDKKIFKTIGGFSAWNLFGTIEGLISNEGVAILINIFFGPIAMLHM